MCVQVLHSSPPAQEVFPSSVHMLEPPNTFKDRCQAPVTEPQMVRFLPKNSNTILLTTILSMQLVPQID